METKDAILEGIGKVTFVTTIDQIMGYYTIEVVEEQKKHLGIILPWGIYQYNVLPQGLKIATDVFQREIMLLLGNLNFARVFIDNILIIGWVTYQEHLNDVETVLKQ